MAEAPKNGVAKGPGKAAKTPDLVGELIWDARRLAKARADAKLDVVVVETKDRPKTVVGQYPPPGEPLPKDRTIKVEVAQSSWVRALPGIYQDTDEEHADFLKRFLAIQQHMALQIDEKLESIHSFFDPRETPEGFLPWLGSWVAMGLHEGWNVERRREVIFRAAEMYKLRGTAKGLKLALALFAEVDIEIEEFRWPYPGFVIGKHSKINLAESTISRPVFETQCFIVKVPVRKSEVSREKLRTIQAVVETEKPAHAHYALEFVTEQEKFEDVPFLQMRKTGRVGVDVRIGGKSDVPPVEEDMPENVPTAA
jgi:phage tail-like protein